MCKLICDQIGPFRVPCHDDSQYPLYSANRCFNTGNRWKWILKPNPTNCFGLARKILWMNVLSNTPWLNINPTKYVGNKAPVTLVGVVWKWNKIYYKFNHSHFTLKSIFIQFKGDILRNHQQYQFDTSWLKSEFAIQFAGLNWGPLVRPIQCNAGQSAWSPIWLNLTYSRALNIKDP